MSFKKLLSIWWNMQWRGVVFGLPAGMLLGLIGGFVAGATRHVQQAGLFGGILGFPAGLVVSVWALREALLKHQVQFAAPSPAQF
ncbi:MAG: hypothetical protein ACK50G_03415 [bacterium]|jgi:hypothetical protein